MLRQGRNPLRRQPRAILERPPLAAFAGRLGHIEQGKIAALAADHGVAGGERAVDQPGTHEPGIQQQAHLAEPLAEQAQQQAGALELAAVGAAADQA